MNRGYVGTILAIIVVVLAIIAALYFGLVKQSLAPSINDLEITSTSTETEIPDTTSASSTPTENEATTTIQLFFQNAKLKPNNIDCGSVVAVTRVINATNEPAKAAINALLAGPTNEEKLKGFTSTIPTGSKLVSIKITDGTAQADFNDATGQGGGSCYMEALTTQIRKTLLQFPTVKKVVLTAGGKSADESFQP